MLAQVISPSLTCIKARDLLQISLQTMSIASASGAPVEAPGLPPNFIVAPRTDPIYNCHAYLTKVPVKAIQPFIEAFTGAGETIMDPFAGSGMTGLAAICLGRDAVLSDISVLGQHIACGYTAHASAESLRAAAESVVNTASRSLGDVYDVLRESDGTAIAMNRTVWSFTYRCPACNAEMVYYQHVASGKDKPTICPSCGAPFARRKWPRGQDVPVEVVFQGQNGKLVSQPISKFEWSRISRAATDARIEAVPSLPIEEHREMYSRSGLRKAGVTRTVDFFSARNAIALLELWRAINAIEESNVRTKLRFAFTAILPRASRRYQWSAKRPLNAQNQTYYIAPVHYEWNVFELYWRKVEASIRADEELRTNAASLFHEPKNGLMSYALASADRLDHVKDNSIDYVFTDPPFGSNIFYSDMSLFHEAWLGLTTDNEKEAVVHTTGKRKSGSQQRYESLLRSAFCEIFRVLKPGRHLSVVFGNSDGRIWGLVQRALSDAGFSELPVHVAVLDKGQRSVKGLNSGSEAVVTVDLILTVQKPRKKASAELAFSSSVEKAAIIREAVEALDKRSATNPSRVYASILTGAIQRRWSLSDFHLSDVLIALRRSGFEIDPRTGMLVGQSD